MIKFDQLFLTILTWFLLGIAPTIRAETKISNSIGNKGPFHGCKDMCEARKVFIELTKSKKKLKVAHQACGDEIQGNVKFIKVNKKERGVCQFSDGSSVELKDIQKLSETN